MKRRDWLPDAPACFDCNGRKAEFESYLASVFPFGGRHADATEKLETKLPGSADRLRTCPHDKA